MKLYGPTNIFLSSDHMSFRDQSCVFINVVLRGWIWSQINIAKKEDWWGKVGEGRSLALLYYLPYAILGGPAVPAALRLPNFLETLSRRFRLFEVLRKWWCFFVEKIAIRRYESNMHLDVGKNLANSKNWKVSRPNAACVHSIWNNEHVFLSGYAKRAAGWKGKSGLLYHLGLTEKKQDNW